PQCEDWSDPSSLEMSFLRDEVDPLGSRSMSGSDRLSGCRSDVLIHTEEIGCVVLLFHCGEARVVFAVGRLEPGITLIVHHKIRIRATKIEGMHGLPIPLGPLGDGPRFLRPWINARKY